jgi:hypothetical protein
MSIRTLSNPITAIDSLRSGETREAKDVKLQISSEDREADGQRKHEEANKNPLTDEELKTAMEYLESLPGLKANGLMISIELQGNVKIFFIKDHEGKVVRRIIEWEMRQITQSKDKKTGQIFDKSA